LFAVALLGVPNFVFASSHFATLSGTVADSSGSVVQGAAVRLHGVAGAGLLTTTSDNTGKYTFAEISPGEYLLEATAAGLNIIQPATVNLLSGDNQHVDIVLAVSAVRTQVSVTAADAPQSVDQISKALDVVSSADAECRGIFSIADSVRYLPGIRVSTSGGPGALTTIQSRGLRPQDTAILIDGFRFRDPTDIEGSSGPYVGDLLLLDASRVEVLRGSGSSLYGTNAMAGTVNIITDTGGGPVHGDLDLQGGGLGLFRGVARAAGGALGNRLTYSAGLARLGVTDGVNSAGAVRNWSGQGGVGFAIAPKIRVNETLFAKTGFAQTSVSPMPTLGAPTVGIIPAIPLTSAQIRLADQNLPYDSGSATFVPSLGDPDAGVHSHFVASSSRFEHQVSSQFSYRLAYSLVDSERNQTDGPAGPGYYQPVFNTSDDYSGRTDTIQARASYLLGGKQILTAGYEWEREQYVTLSTDANPDPTERAHFRTEAEQRTNAAFAQDEMRLFSGRLAALLSARYTAASLDQPTFVNAPSAYAGIALPKPPAAYTGDASVAYFLRGSSTKLRAHVGNSFRLPSLYERFGEYTFDGFAYPLGDPRLSPERAISTDAGIDQYLAHDHLRVSATYFYSHLQQVIDYTYFPPGYVDPFGRYSGYYNTGGGYARGVEVSGEFRPARKTTVSASYTYTNAKDRISQYYASTPIEPLQSVRILPNQVKIVALQQLGSHVDLALDFDGGSKYLFPLYGYAYQFPGPRELGLAAGYSIPLGERIATRVYVRVSNTLDKDYYENGFRTPGRWAVAGIRVGF
jgi:iron complex outermembrane receptor protein